MRLKINVHPSLTGQTLLGIFSRLLETFQSLSLYVFYPGMLLQNWQRVLDHCQTENQNHCLSDTFQMPLHVGCGIFHRSKDMGTNYAFLQQAACNKF